jgi:hypothetical protein
MILGRAPSPFFLGPRQEVVAEDHELAVGAADRDAGEALPVSTQWRDKGPQRIPTRVRLQPVDGAGELATYRIEL